MCLMKVIITQSNPVDIQIELDDEAQELDEFAVAKLFEDAIHILQCELQNIYSSVE